MQHDDEYLGDAVAVTEEVAAHEDHIPSSFCLLLVRSSIDCSPSTTFEVNTGVWYYFWIIMLEDLYVQVGDPFFPLVFKEKSERT